MKLTATLVSIDAVNLMITPPFPLPPHFFGVIKEFASESISVGDANSLITRPFPAGRTTLLAAGIPIVEHLTGLGALPPTGYRFTAEPRHFIPPK
ncbi:hypothetical protein ACH495_05310 [Micromonospora sp. NPDC018662]|uniref:hypothetical protein n=1 Tax=Micromonospora sp. NPDC018662 TaxID=3364238 RepID=UPI0037A3B986